VFVERASEEQTPMPARPGFARLLPLMMLTGLAASTVALLASARPVQAPQRQCRVTRCPTAARSISDDGGCSEVSGSRKWS